MYDLNDLYTRYLNKQCSPEEVRMLLAHFHLTGETSSLRPRILQELAKEDGVASDSTEVENALERVHQRLINDISATGPSSKIKQVYWFSGAAAVLLCVLAGGWLFMRNTEDRTQAIANYADVAPGGNKATLTTEDGRTVDLNETADGIVIGNEITYVDGTPVRRQQAAGLIHKPVSQLVLTTPKGGTYRVTLSDGTTVWLNAASTLKYPNRFAEKERVVQLEGEAYFDVSKGAPFRVLSNGQTVEVLGTQFNVSAYSDEPRIRTTLVEGSVRIEAESHAESVKLLPGEQSTLTADHLEKSRVDIASVVAWKEGLFRFDETELRMVMNQLSRWYNVTVEYQGVIPVTFYYGVISRKESLSTVLDLLRQSGLNFKIDKTRSTNKVIVLP